MSLGQLAIRAAFDAEHGGMTSSFPRLARGSAFATAVVGVTYSVAFTVVVQRGSEWAQWTAAAALTAGGLFALPVLVAITSLLAERLGAAGPARVALIVGAISAVLSSLHGAYDLAALATPASATAGDISPVDPSGFATFALAGLAVIVIAALSRDDLRFARWLPSAGVVLGVALVATWLGRLTVLDPTSAWLRITTTVAAILNPIVYVGFGSACRASAARISRPAAMDQEPARRSNATRAAGSVV